MRTNPLSTAVLGRTKELGLGLLAVITVTAIALAAPVCVAQGTAADRLVEIGTPLELALSADPSGSASVEFIVVPDEGLALTIDASSVDDDVVLQRLGDDGAIVAEADDGGIGWNARMIIDAQAGERVRLRASLKHLPAGRVVIVSQRGDPGLPTGFALAQESAEWRIECGQAARERGAVDVAMDDLLAAGQQFYALGSYADCRRAMEELQPLAEHAPDPSWLQAVCEGYLGAVHLRFGDASKARDLLVRSRDGAVAHRQAGLELFCQANLGQALMDIGDPAGARLACDRALLIARTISDVANEISVLALSATLADVEGDPGSARQQFARAIELASELGDPGRRAVTLREHGHFLRERGELAAAELELTEALGLEVPPAERAAVTGELGNVRLAQGRWPEARLLFEQVLDSALDLGDVGLELVALESLAVGAARAGDTTQAVAHLDSARRLLADSDDRAGRVRVFVVTSALEAESGDWSEARKALDQAVALADESASADLRVLVLGQECYLDAHDRTRLEKGLQCAQQQLELSRNASLPDGEAQALSALAWLQLEQGRADEAEPFAEQAVAAARLATPERLAEALSTQLDVALARRDLATARGAMTEARSLLGGLPARGIGIDEVSRQRARWNYAQFAELEQDVVALGLDQASSAENRQELIADGFRAACRAQGRALLEGITEHRSGARSAEVTALRRERQGLLADRHSTLVALSAARRSGASPDVQATLRARAAECAERSEALLDELRRRSPGDAVIDAATELDPEVARRDLLQDGGTLVQFAEGQEHLYAFVVDPTTASWHDLGERGRIGGLVRDVLGGMSDPAHLASARQVAAAGYAAWSALLAPLLPSGGQGRLLIVPTPALAALPFEALVMNAAPDAGDFSGLQFVIDRYEVSYGPSVPVLSLLASVPPRSGEPKLLVLADALVPGEESYPAPVPRLLTESSTWARLPGTRSEAMAILDLVTDALAGNAGGSSRAHLPEGRNGRLQTEQMDVYVGAEASTARVTEAPRRYSILHFAAHGAVDASDPSRSGLVLTASGQNDDGFLSVPEVLDLDLDADLVVLSACDTARGPVRRGEGVQSLAWAFLYAGAREVVATLWQVDDRETEVAMREFYRGLRQGGLGTAASLREARLGLRHATAEPGTFAGTGRGKPLPGTPQRAAPAGAPAREMSGHPYFWAPFISIGPAR